MSCSKILALAAAALFWVGGTQVSASAVLSVPAQYPTLEKAVAAASAGDTVTITDNATYTTPTLRIDKSLVLENPGGAKFAGRIQITGDGTSVTLINLNASNPSTSQENLTVEDGTRVRAINCNLSGGGRDGLRMVLSQKAAWVHLIDCNFSNTFRYAFVVAGQASASPVTTYTLILDGCKVNNSGTNVLYTNAGRYNIDMTFRNCEILGATGSSLLLANSGADPAVAPLNKFRFERCVIGAAAGKILLNGGSQYAGVSMTNCLLDGGSYGLTNIRGDVTLQHCTFVNQDNYGFSTVAETRALDCRNNILAGPAGSAFIHDATTNVRFTNNVVLASAAKSTRVGTLLADATNANREAASLDQIGFVGYNATFGLGNYDLTNSSVAIRAGTNLGLADDIKGRQRPNPAGSAPDAGAYEAGAVSAVYGWAFFG